MPLSTNFNVSPYYDDFDPDKNYHKVLFRPSLPVQARELTQLQTILQDQIERFGNNIYKTGTIIEGCTVLLNTLRYTKIRDLTTQGLAVNLNNYANCLVLHETSNLSARIVSTIIGYESTSPDLNTLYLLYTNTGNSQEKEYSEDNVLKIFNPLRRVEKINIVSGGTLYSNSDTITITGGGGAGAQATITTHANGTISDVSLSNRGTGYTTTPNVSISTSTGLGGSLSPQIFIDEVIVANSAITSNAVGKALGCGTSEGIIYQKGHFIRVYPHLIVVEKYTQDANNKSIIFDTVESIVNSNVDSTLLDNATGYPNFSAPGANRVKLTANLAVVNTADLGATSDVIPIYELQSGRIVKDNLPTAFNSLEKELNKRTFEESGSYVVRPLQMQTEKIQNNTTHMYVTISPGIAYVRGRRFEIVNNYKKAVRKATDTATITNQSVNTRYGNYVLVRQMYGMFNVKEAEVVALRDTAATDLNDRPAVGGAPTTPGATIGTAKVRSIEFASGVPGTPTAQYRLYLFDIRMAKGYSFKQTKSISATSTAVADVVLNGLGEAVLEDVILDSLVFNTGAEAVLELTEEDFTFRTVTNGAFDSTGSETISFSGSNTLPYGTGVFTDSLKSEIIIVPVDSFRLAANNTGTVTTTSAGANINGTGTTFLTDYTVGDYITVSNGASFSTPRRITKVANNTRLTVSAAFGEDITTNNHTQVFPAYAPIDFTKGSRSIEQLSNTSLQISIGETINATSAAFTMVHDLKEASPAVRTKTVVSPVYVKLSTDSVSASNKGPWCLGIPDVYQIDGVYVGSSNTYSTSTTNSASKFELITGQHDSFYGLSYLRLKPNSGLNLSNTNNLLVKLKAFTHSTGLYLSTESYPVDDTSSIDYDTNITTAQIPLFTSPVSGQTLALRDCVDFRPIVSNTAVLSSSVGSASIDPSTTETFAGGEKYFPSPSSSFEATIESYLRRIDRVVLDSSGGSSIIEGVPSISPTPPEEDDTSMTLGYVSVPPFPSLSAPEASILKRPDLGARITLTQIPRYTMKEIGDLEKRIRRLEYYALLNTLEQETKNLTLTGESNTSIERFKNGFFVDAFNNYAISNLNDFEYAALIDPDRKVLTPQKDSYLIDLKYSNTASLNTVNTNDFVTLPYTEKVMLEQPFASKQRVCVEQAWVFRSALEVVPNFDNFFDNKFLGVQNVTIDVAQPTIDLVNALNDTAAIRNQQVDVVVRTSPTTSTIVSDRTVGYTQTIVRELSQEIETTTTRRNDQLILGGTKTTTTSLGAYVNDVGVSKYMRGQKIALYSPGLRPGARHYVFFDGVDVTNYAVPASIDQSEFGNVTLDSFKVTSLPRNVNLPFANSTIADTYKLVANTTGELCCVVFIPENTFTTGERQFLVMDIPDLDSELSATSKATGRFASFTLNGTSSEATVSVRSFDDRTKLRLETFTEVNVDNQTRRWNTTETIDHTPAYEFDFGDGGGDGGGGGGDPIGQSFIVEGDLNEGTVYLTSVDVYFAEKSDTATVTLDIRPVEEGYPSRRVLPFSLVRKSANQVNVSADASLPTTFTFSKPIPVELSKEYIFVITPGGNTPDYRIYTSKAGDAEVSNNSVVTHRAFSKGTLFYSTSNRTFTAVQDEDIKFTIRKAEFTTTSGTAVFTNDDTEYLTVANVVNGFIGGEEIAQMSNSYLLANGVSTNSSSTNTFIKTGASLVGSLSVDDKVLVIYGSNSTQSTATISTSGKNVSNGSGTPTAFTTDYANGDFILINNEIRQVVSISNDSVMLLDAALQTDASSANHYSIDTTFDIFTVSSGGVIANGFYIDSIPSLTTNGSVVASIQRVVAGKVKYYNPDNAKLYIGDSSAANDTFKIFTSNSTYLGYLVSEVSDSIATVTSIDNVEFYNLAPYITKIVPPTTTVNLEFNLLKPAGSTVSSKFPFIGRSELLVANTALVKSKSNEISGTTITKSLSANIQLQSLTVSETSPLIDARPISIVCEEYRVNDDDSDENTRYGNATCKYVSKRIELADGLDAEDVKVFISGYKPSGTSIKVYAKILNSSDSANFNDKDWSELRLVTSSTLFSSTINKEDFKEYEYTFRQAPTSTILVGAVETNGSTTVTGSNTEFSTNLSNGDLVIVRYSSLETDYDIIPVANVNSNTELLLTGTPSANGDGLTIEKVTKPYEAFKYYNNSNIVRYYDNTLATYDTYKYLAIKIVLLSPYDHIVPAVDDVRVICCSV